ncbi:glycosyltransferase family 2 protein [Parafrigoribacterium humi]|jgi:glycosyltransferase involved in cell wall biosynthesis|uniref:glycosyltransferase family 2 protein n=1 Tax=Parafrigoribacterium humi TaxID=3144664 RepID=UPI0032EC0924
MPEIVQLHQRALPRISIVIPAMNEAKNLEVILSELPPVHQVILVDGNSVDDTVATARRVMPGIEVVHQTRTGKGNALACGFAAVTGDVVVMFDADGSADPTEIPAFVDALMAGADVAKGSRFCAGGGSEDITVFRRLGNFGLNVLTNLLLKTRYTDLCYGYNAFWASVLPYLDLPDVSLPKLADGRMHWGDGFEIETVLTCRVKAANLTVTEVPSVERLRIFGVSNLNAISDGFRVLRTILQERSRVVKVPGVVSARPAHTLHKPSKSTDLSLKSA